MIPSWASPFVTEEFIREYELSENCDRTGDPKEWSDEFRVRVAGLPPRFDATQFIPRELVLQAMGRSIDLFPRWPLVLGIDVGHTNDRSVIVPRRGRKVLDNIRVVRGSRTIQTCRSRAYALSAPDEFFAMALTNKSTQKFLEQGSLWDRLVDGVRKLFGLEARFKPMLDRVLKAGGEILDAAKVDPERPVDGGINLSKGFFKSVGDQIFDSEDIARDFEKFRGSVKSPIETLKAVTAPLRNSLRVLDRRGSPSRCDRGLHRYRRAA